MSVPVVTSSVPAKAPTIPIAALENLASRFRGSGVYLVMLNPQAGVVYHDAGAGLFFNRYVLPLLQYRESDDLRSAIAQLTPASGVSVLKMLPGVLLAAFPYVEKKQVMGTLVLAAKSSEFRLGEEVVRVCSQLGLDATWLSQQADAAITYNDEHIQTEARMLQNMLRDQVKLASLERELESLSGQLANTYEELSLIYQLSSGMRVNRRASEFFKQACLDVMEVMSVKGMGFALHGDSFRNTEPVLYGSLSLPPGTVRKLTEELVSVLKQRKTPLLINHLSKDKTFQWMGEYAQQLLAVPLQRQDEVLGCIFGIDKNVGEFDSVDSKLLNSIGNESAIYLENAMLFDDVHGLMMGLLHSLTSAVDAKDAYTCGHSERVALLSRQLAIESKLSEYQVDRIYMAGLLHDVGKIGVPEAVLQKCGKLTDEEFAQIKKHPEIGAKILRDIKQVEDIIPGVLHHHERYDGRGYPHGLAGEKIPLMGRIICLADCFDAMTSSRTYRKALPLESALAEIRKCAGTQFDPTLAECFLKIPEPQLVDLLRDHQVQSKKLIEMHQTVRGS
ncbi:MAG TPA: HD domain-containing phosphohydrolase [Tepidisphaeraceae bacterium]|nr:HD domain-containing phosphohydrolase [Tepidisphaeraceae bacterium]